MQSILNNEYNPQLFIIGRESRGISQNEMSKQLGISQGKLSKIENGLLPVNEEEINLFSQLLNYPISFFSRNEKTYGVGLSEFFHRKKQAVPQKVLSKIYARLEIRRMEIFNLLRSVEIGGDDFPYMDPDQYNGNVEQIAQTMRASWKLQRGPIQNIVDIIEEAGGIVIPFDFEGANVDAICLSHPGSPPLVFTNFDRPMDRIRFTLAHEIGHLVMHRKPPSEDTDIEEQADRFASEFLMPKSEISSQLVDINLKKLATLKPYWKVSMAALLVRSRDLGKLADRQYRHFWMQMGQAGYRTREPVELDVPLETPLTLEEVIGVYQNDFKYTQKDICEVLKLNEVEASYYYPISSSHLRRVK
ncbi:ImmA/IrrE family metallo-endopeptidase [Paenibacillus sp. NRS-1760]|uniref:ImmA/IrrE family metallo-endopeptidase n=1 Tax=Paenibacillus sp. NRS-1760 TaxID=3233902 RepID=UPI003D298F90